MKKRTALITGGSSGLGYALSRHFARAAYRILWVSKPAGELDTSRQRLLGEFPEIEIHTLSKDLTREESAGEVMVWVEENGWQVDVLVNNAGIGNGGFLHETDLQWELNILKLNMLHVYHMSRTFLSPMISRNAGSIINISSNSALQPIARMITYSSSKAFVKHFTEGLAEEMRLLKSQVHIMCVCPAAIKDTPFKEVAETADMKTFQGLATTDVETVAKDIWKGFQRKQALVVSGSRMRFLYRIRHFIPFRLKMAIVKSETERTT